MDGGVSTMTDLQSPPSRSRGRRKIREGLVVSNAMDRTVVVVTDELKPHPLYKKVVRHRVRFKAHDEGNACSVGDRVRIAETRPLSKDKRWRVAEILEKAK
jgi:small subunit ribosomal protein S17